MKKALKILIIFLFPIYVGFCICLYFLQERMIFNPEKLDDNHQFDFEGDFEEVRIQAADGISLHGLLFKAPMSKGVILYLHGNSGTVNDYGKKAKHYTELGQDLFILDYRGYGKSEGEILSEKQFYGDVQLAYDKLKELYDENDITVIGYSVGSASAAMLAANNNPKQLILKAPYYSIVDMTDRRYPMVPTYLLKYKFRTNRFLKKTTCPITIFHGNQDDVIYYGASVRLSKRLKPTDQFITLDGQNHGDLEANTEYLKSLAKLF